MAEDRDESRGFTISDRRRFSDEGEARPDAGASGPAEASRGHDTQRDPDDAGRSGEAKGGESAAHASHLPEITLSTFIMSLSTQVLMHMGEIPNPIDNTVKRDMSAAKQVIDILGMLKEKTKGNLEKNEETLFDNMLYDLRMRYVELAKG